MDSETSLVIAIWSDTLTGPGRRDGTTDRSSGGRGGRLPVETRHLRTWDWGRGVPAGGVRRRPCAEDGVQASQQPGDICRQTEHEEKAVRVSRGPAQGAGGSLWQLSAAPKKTHSSETSVSLEEQRGGLCFKQRK